VDMQHYAVEHYITGSRLMLEYNEQVPPTVAMNLYNLVDPDASPCEFIYFLLTLCYSFKTDWTIRDQDMLQRLLVLKMQAGKARGLAGRWNKKAQLTQGIRTTVPSFQDGGNSAIRSADPKNPCLEPDM